MHKPTCHNCGGSYIAIELYEPTIDGKMVAYFEFNSDTLIQYKDLLEVKSKVSFIKPLINEDIHYRTMCCDCCDSIEMEYNGLINGDAVRSMFNDFLRDLSINKIVK